MKTHIYFRPNLAQLFLKWEMFQSSVVEKVKHTFCVQWLFTKIWSFMR